MYVPCKECKLYFHSTSELSIHVSHTHKNTEKSEKFVIFFVSRKEITDHNEILHEHSSEKDQDFVVNLSNALLSLITKEDFNVIIARNCLTQKQA